MVVTDRQLFALLGPWHGALRAGCHGADHDTSPPPIPLSSSAHGRSVDGTRVLWISARRDGVGPLAEALDLLALAARASASAVSYAVAQLWPERLAGWFDDDHESAPPPPFVPGLSVTVRHIENLAPLSDWLTGFHNYSDDYMRVRDILHAHGNGDGPADELVVPVRVYCEERGDSVLGDCRFDEILHALVPLVMLQHRPSDKSHQSTVASSSGARFDVRQVEFGDLEMAITVKSLLYMGQLAEWGVTFNHLPAIRDCSNIPCSASITRALHRLLAVPGQASRIARGVTTLAVLDDTQWEILLAVLSAAQASTTLRHVRVKTTSTEFGAEVTAQRFQLWKWIAYMLMSHHANGSIRKLDTDVDDLTIHDVADMKRLAKAQDPLRMVLAYPGDDGVRTWIAARRFYLVDPKRELTTIVSSRILVLDTAMQVRTVCAPDTNSQWWGVLLPGCGLAWVLDDDAVRGDTEPPPPDLTVTAATEVFLGTVEEADMPATSALLKLLGTDLQQVEADQIDPDVQADDWFQEMCAHCPHLDCIKLHSVCLSSAQTVIDLYTRGMCRASVLHLKDFGNNYSEHALHTYRLLDALQDPRNTIAQRVQDIYLHIYIGESADTKILDNVHRMLQENHRLHSVHVSIYIPYSERNMIDSKAIQLSFAKYKTELQTIRSGPLDIRRKLALLSVVQSPRSEVGEWAVQSLDTSVLVNVFQFAAQRRVRKVVVDFKAWE